MTKIIAPLVCVFSLLFPQVSQAQNLPGQPSNSYTIGTDWYCKSGYRKQGNRCVNIFDETGGQPSNSYTIGTDRYCKSGYRKQGNRCVNIFAGNVDESPTKPAMARDAARDSEVYQVQLYLIDLGYDPGVADGRLGPRTKRAIEVFQGDQGLGTNGKIDRSLLVELEAVVQIRERKKKAPQDSIAESKPELMSKFTWPRWRAAVSKPTPVIVGTPMNPAQVYEAVKDTVWVIVAGRTTLDFEQLRELTQGSAVAISRNSLLTLPGLL